MPPESAATRPHLIQHLGIRVESIGDGVTHGLAEIRPDHLAGGGTAMPGHLATLVDMVGGMCASRSTQGTTVTSSLHLHAPRPVGTGEVHAEARAVRIGGRTVVTAVTLTDGTGAVVGGATLASARLEPRPGQQIHRRRFVDGEGVEHRPFWMRPPATTHADTPLLDHLGIRLRAPTSTAPGGCDLALRDDLRNGNNVLHGGAGAFLVDRAAAVAAGHELGATVTVDTLSVHYLAPARTGPFEARAVVLSRAGDRATVRVEVTDTGHDRGVLTGLVGTRG